MVARISTVAFQGIDVLEVDVQVHIAAGLPAFTITVNLAPADVLKEGSHFDLPIALGLLTAMGVVPADAVSGHSVLGEVTLAHLGVLFLDELPEFPRQVLDSLRQPLETGRVSVARANSHVTYPARVQLVAAMNPCRCGYLGDPAMACSRAPNCAIEYQTKISGPLFDRIDIHVDVPAVDPADLSLPPPAEGTAEVAARVAAARAIQTERYASPERAPPVRTNAEADGELLSEVASPDADGQALLAEGSARMRLTARGYHRVLRVARTLADLEAAAGVTGIHIAEALSYRRIGLRQ